MYVKYQPSIKYILCHVKAYSPATSEVQTWLSRSQVGRSRDVSWNLAVAMAGRVLMAVPTKGAPLDIV